MSGWNEVVQKASVRNRYFYGKLLSQEDLTLEQDYHRAKRRLINQWVLGWGVVSGLEVTPEKSPAGHPHKVCISPGMALDPAGREIIVAAPFSASICPGGKSAGKVHLVISYNEAEEAPVPAYAASPDGGNENSRVRESYRLEIVSGPAPRSFFSAIKPGRLSYARLEEMMKRCPVPDEEYGGGVPLAEVTVRGRRLIVDTSFRRLVISPRMLQYLLPFLFQKRPSPKKKAASKPRKKIRRTSQKKRSRS